MDTIKGCCYTGQSCIQRFYHPNTHLSDRLITRGTLNSGYRCCKYRLFRLFIACVNQKHATIQLSLGAFTNKYTCLSTHVHAHIHTNTCLNTHVHLLVHTGARACAYTNTCYRIRPLSSTKRAVVRELSATLVIVSTWLEILLKLSDFLTSFVR